AVRRAVARQRSPAALERAARGEIPRSGRARRERRAGARARANVLDARQAAQRRRPRRGYGAGRRASAGGGGAMSAAPSSFARAVAGLVLVTLVASCGGGGNANVLRIPLGAGGVGFLPLLMMREHNLVEQAAARAGTEGLEVQWIDLGGPSVMNDALLSGSVDVIAAGPPAFLTLWDRTRGSLDVKGVAAMSSIPMYLNTRSERLTRLDDVGPSDKIAVTAIKVSIPAIVMQMYAAERYGAADAERFDRYTVSMTHPDGVLAMLSGSS